MSFGCFMSFVVINHFCYRYVSCILGHNTSLEVRKVLVEHGCRRTADGGVGNYVDAGRLPAGEGPLERRADLAQLGDLFDQVGQSELVVPLGSPHPPRMITPFELVWNYTWCVWPLKGAVCAND